MASKFRWLFFVLALAVLAGMAHVWIESQARSAETLYQSALDRLDRVEPDYASAMSELDLAFDMARADGDPRIARNVLLLRAEVFQRRGSFDLTLEDCELILDEFSPRDLEVLELASEAALQLGETQRALAYANKLLAAAPTGGNAKALIGAAHFALADAALAQARVELNDVLADETADEAWQAVQEAAVLVPGALPRFAALDRIAARVPDPEVQERIFNAIDEAGERQRQARAAYLDAIESGTRAEAAEGLLELLVRAGALEESATIGRVILALERYDDTSRVLRLTADALYRLERPAAARVTIREIVDDPNRELAFGLMDSDELPRWCELLYRLQYWDQLISAAGVMTRRSMDYIDADPPVGRSAYFYMGMAQLNTKNMQGAIRTLEYFLDEPDVEPLPFAQLTAQLGHARAARELGRVAAERESLEFAVALMPPDGRVPDALRKVMGEAMFSVGVRQMRAGNAIEAEGYLTHAMSLQPESAHLIEPKWEEAGRRAMLQRGRDIDQVLKDIDGWEDLSRRRMGPYEQWRVSEQRLRLGHPQRAMLLMDRVLEDYPGFPLALEMMSRAYAERGDTQRSAAALFELAGAPRYADKLSELPLEGLSGAQLVQLTRIKPRHYGLLPVVQELVANERPDLAFNALRYGIRRLNGDGIVLAAELAAQLGRWNESLVIFNTLEADSEAFGANVGLAIRVAARARPTGRDPHPLQRMLHKVAAAPELDADELLIGIDTLFLDQRYDELAIVLHRAEGVGGERPGDLLLRRALLGILRTRPEEVLESLALLPGGRLLREALISAMRTDVTNTVEVFERAEPYFDHDEPSVGRMLFFADREDWDEVERVAELVERNGRWARANPQRKALLAGLAGRWVEAHDAFTEVHRGGGDLFAELGRVACAAAVLEPDEATDGEPTPVTDPAARLLREGNRPLEPRFVLALLLALEDPVWSHWTFQRVKDLPPERYANPWATCLGAHALSRIGERDQALAVLVKLTADAPEHVFAWRLRERYLRERITDPDDAERIELAARRLEATGDELGLGQREVLLARVFLEEERGDIHPAIALVVDALAESPGDLLLEHKLAWLLVLAGEFYPAVEAYTALFDEHDVEATRHIVPEYLDLIEFNALIGQISYSAWWALLESLEAQIPLEPAVARELAALTVQTAGERPDWGVTRAWERLDRFRERTDHVAIEDQRAGEARRWLELYIEHDPDQAVKFAQLELEARPASPEMWRAWGEALSAAGQRKRALRDYQTFLTIVPEPSVLRATARLLAELGESRGRVRAAVRLIREVEGIDQPDAELLFIKCIASLNGGRRDRSEAINTLKQLWARRRSTSSQVNTRELGWRLVSALLQRNHPGDPQLARIGLDELQVGVEEPLERDFITVLSYLAVHAEEREAELRALEAEMRAKGLLGNELDDELDDELDGENLGDPLGAGSGPPDDDPALDPPAGSTEAAGDDRVPPVGVPEDEAAEGDDAPSSSTEPQDDAPGAETGSATGPDDGR